MSSRTNRHLTKKQLRELEDKVQAERERIHNKLNLEGAQKSMSGETNSGRDEVDSANDDIIRHTELRFATREALYLKKLLKTLTKMESDEYGMCEECGSPISYTRLMARPTSTMCIVCKEEAERDEMQCFHGRQSKSGAAIGKSVALK